MKYKKLVAIIFVTLVVCVCGYYIIHAATVVTINEDKLYLVERVLDGDTFVAKVGWHDITVRMLGIDTPETVDPRKPEQCYGKEASNETKSLLSGKSVHLKLNPNREEKDRYGRYLAFVYLDGVMINQLLLENGFAREYTYGKAYMFQKEFKKIEEQTRKTEKGLWGECVMPDYKISKPQIL